MKKQNEPTDKQKEELKTNIQKQLRELAADYKANAEKICVLLDKYEKLDK